MASVHFAKLEEHAQKAEAFKTGIVVNYAKMIENVLTISGGRFIAG
jgi:hypothetical protein